MDNERYINNLGKGTLIGGIDMRLPYTGISSFFVTGCLGVGALLIAGGKKLWKLGSNQ